MEEFIAIVEPELGLANVGDDVEFSCNDRYVEDSSSDYSISNDTHLSGADYNWDASPIILRDGRFELVDDNRMLRILNLQPSDNNTNVVCRVDGTYAGKTYKPMARGMIRLYSNEHHVTAIQNGESTQPTATFTEDGFANISVRNELATSLNQFSLTPLSVVIVGSVLLSLLLVISLLAYRRRTSSVKKSPLKRNLRTVSRENSYQSTRCNTATPRSFAENVFANIEGSKPSTSFCAIPVVSVTGASDDEVYAVPGECESNTVPSRKRSKRYLSPTNNKRRQESHSHVYGRVDGGNQEPDGEYECMDAGNPRLRNCVSQPNLKGYHEHRYVNWKQSQNDSRFSAPIYSTQINQNANADEDDDAVGTLSDTSSVEYAELDLGVSSGLSTDSAIGILWGAPHSMRRYFEFYLCSGLGNQLG